MTTKTPHCLNCGTALCGALFCGQCGQAANTQRLALADIWNALVHVMFHADHSVFSLVRNLAIRPGHVAREYVEGRRKTHFNPFTFAVVVIGVAALLMAATRFVDFGDLPANPVTSFIQRNLNLLIFLQIPLLALFGMLLNRREQLRFAEHMVLAAYASGFRSLFFMAVVIPVWVVVQKNAGVGVDHAALIGLYLLVWLAYYGFASAQFFTGHRVGLWCKGVAVGVLTQTLTSLLIWFAIVLWLNIAPNT
jgi:hypothetical protein